jgi:hypothetical protein
VSRASFSSFRLSPFFVLSFSSFWFSSNRHPAFVALFICSSLPFLVILFVSRNVRLMPTVCSHRQFIFVGPVEVRGRVIEDDGSSYHFPLTFCFYAQVTLDTREGLIASSLSNPCRSRFISLHSLRLPLSFLSKPSLSLPSESSFLLSTLCSTALSDETFNYMVRLFKPLQ